MSTHKTEGYVNIRGGELKGPRKLYMKIHLTEIAFYKEQFSTMTPTKRPIFTIKIANTFLRKKVSTMLFGIENESTTFELLENDKYYQICCDTNDEFNDWISSLSPLIHSIGYFGYPLSVAVEKSGWKIPLPLYRFIPFLEDMGYYQTPQVFDTKITKPEKEKYLALLELENDINTTSLPPRIAFHLTSLFIESIPEPLIQRDYFDFKREFKCDSQLTQVDCIKRALSGLSNENKDTATYILRHIFNLYSYSECNNCSVKILSLLYGKCFLNNSKDSECESILFDFFKLMLSEFEFICEDMIDHFQTMGTPPPYPAKPSKQINVYQIQVQGAIEKYFLQFSEEIGFVRSSFKKRPERRESKDKKEKPEKFEKKRSGTWDDSSDMLLCIGELEDKDRKDLKNNSLPSIPFGEQKRNEVFKRKNSMPKIQIEPKQRTSFGFKKVYSITRPESVQRSGTISVTSPACSEGRGSPKPFEVKSPRKKDFTFKALLNRGKKQRLTTEIEIDQILKTNSIEKKGEKFLVNAK
ncbi:hypothetical protein EIN_185070 [Entamoeba invadens IP1]|uniref:hypothetical protein n=1 Tax=Entamoeba invadens IP1 TaxID=370355 RepID=UPI0002C3E630|nr:hypothetical protein EIN_185070 [Entamoeba invadens IP1]ELP94130.1 hypothetical protein EIN_185070 [Entamoeba invadens IP1]|eukprot:XP_004260901.1 hypothetical protein EIN_185070 [Entamoeba invadens IP1]